MSNVLCAVCSGRGCKDCGGLGVLVCECQPESQEQPTFAEYYHDEIERAGYIRLAAANGYIKLEPGQCVVQVELLEAVIADMRNDCDCSDGYCNNECGGTDCRVKDLTAALDAANIGGICNGI